jgi:DNA-binding transcriptional MerR regulator
LEVVVVSAQLDKGESLMSIGRLAAETGVSSRTIRYYEELGILPTPPRSPGGTRQYPDRYRFYVEGALALKELGFNLEEIKLISRLTLGQPMTVRQRRQAEAIIEDKKVLLERRIDVMTRLRHALTSHQARRGPSGDAVAVLRDLVGIARQDPVETRNTA